MQNGLIKNNAGSKSVSIKVFNTMASKMITNKVYNAIAGKMIVIFFLCITVIVLIGRCIPENANAVSGATAKESANAAAKVSTKIVGKGVIRESNLEYRHLQTVQTKWTGKKYISKKWYKLNKGDMLYYSEKKGSCANINIAVGYGAVKATFQIPMGKAGKNSIGIGKTAPRKGYYRIAVNKKVTMTVKTYQTRKYNNAKRRGEGKWSKGKTVKKQYQVRCVNVYLVRKK